jgi:hypothetical protein
MQIAFVSGDELKKKIKAEQDEIERLEVEIVEVRSIRGDSFDADDWSDSDSSYESGDDDELQDILQQLLRENANLEVRLGDGSRLGRRGFNEKRKALQTLHIADLKRNKNPDANMFAIQDS